MDRDKLSLDAVIADIWQLLHEGATQRKSPLHTPVLASTDVNGRPRQRIMVLREANREQSFLRFHTDSRSPKIRDFADNPSASVLGYDADKKVQLRMHGIANVETNSMLADTAWSASALFSRRCYLIEQSPGTTAKAVTTGLPLGLEGQKPSEEETELARDNFAIIRFKIVRIDWLYLHNQGNISAFFERSENRMWQGDWQIP